jgi:ADP-heptose:LPS heptosyltransferase
MRALLLRLLGSLLRALRSNAPRGAAPCVVVLQYAKPLGCCVHGTPLYAALKEALPGLTLVVATRGLGLQTLEHNPHVDHLLTTAADPTTSLSALLQTAQDIRRQLAVLHLQPTLILQDANNRAPRFALLSALLRLAPTAGFADAPPLYDTYLEYDTTRSLIENNLRLVSLLTAPPQHHEPQVWFTQPELQRAHELLEASPSPRAAFVVQGSGGQRTGWHDDRFAAVIRHVEASGFQPVFLGTAADAATIDRIRHAAGVSGLSLAGRTSVPELAAVLCLCDVLVSLDTGTMHVGRAAGLPMIVLGPSWQQPLEWLPIDRSNVRILRGLDRTSVPSDYKLDEIDAAAVTAAFDDLTRAYPPSEVARSQRIRASLSNTRA